VIDVNAWSLDEMCAVPAQTFRPEAHWQWPYPGSTRRKSRLLKWNDIGLLLLGAYLIVLALILLIHVSRGESTGYATNSQFCPKGGDAGRYPGRPKNKSRPWKSN
jgi:hypothetical protein